MNASDILKIKGSDVAKIDEGRAALDAISLLVERKIGALIVENAAGDVVGIVSERDILIESDQRSQRLGETKVSAIMTRDLVTAHPDDSLADMLELMTQNRVRHLPVMSEGGMCGVLSIGDLVKAQLDAVRAENKHLRDYIVQG